VFAETLKNLGHLLEVLVLLVVVAVEESYQMVQAHLHLCLS
jgi:hypothetical protein